MIELNLFIGAGDPEKSYFENSKQLSEGIDLLKAHQNSIWLAVGGKYPKMEIIVTESVTVIQKALELHTFKFNKDENGNYPFFIQQYFSYEDAYSVALDMREPNPKCYNRVELN